MSKEEQLLKLEIIIPEQWLNSLIELLDTHGIPGYTVFNPVREKGISNVDTPVSGYIGASQYKFVMSVCSSSQHKSVLPHLRDFLEEIRGTMLWYKIDGLIRG